MVPALAEPFKHVREFDSPVRCRGDGVTIFISLKKLKFFIFIDLISVAGYEGVFWGSRCELYASSPGPMVS